VFTVQERDRVRDRVLELAEAVHLLACRRLGLPARHGRGFDDLPAEVLAAFADALVRSLGRDELLRALRAAVAGLLRESAEAAGLAARVEPQLRGPASVELG
jgi:hypothetical protein